MAVLQLLASGATIFLFYPFSVSTTHLQTSCLQSQKRRAQLFVPPSSPSLSAPSTNLQLQQKQQAQLASDYEILSRMYLDTQELTL